jgi:hypothetical protein
VLSPHEKLTREIIEGGPVIQELFAKSKAEDEDEDEDEGRIEGMIKGLQIGVLRTLQVRFPTLAATSRVQQIVASMKSAGELDLLLRALLLFSDERDVRVLLQLPRQGDLL